MNKSIRNLLIIFISFGVYYFLDESFFAVLRSWFVNQIGHLGLSHFLTYTILGIPLFIGCYLIDFKMNILEKLGLKASVTRAFLLALLFTLPMFVGYAIVFEFNAEFTINRFLLAVLAAGFFEELYFRGFLFGLPFKFTRLGFIPSVIIGALLFGAVHLYQSADFGQSVGIFAVTFMGAVLFAWVYVEWKFNLWVPIFLHMLMNLSWDLFSVGENALGGVYSNVFRAITIAVVIIFTLMYKRKKGLKISVNRSNLWMKKPETNRSLKENIE